MAAQEFEARVSVIVQKRACNAGVKELVAKLDGKVTEDLRLVNPFVAELKAKDVPQLAVVEGLRWVSLDVPAHYSTATNISVAMGIQSIGIRESEKRLLGTLNGRGSTMAARLPSCVGSSRELTASALLNAFSRSPILDGMATPQILSSTDFSLFMRTL